MKKLWILAVAILLCGCAKPAPIPDTPAEALLVEAEGPSSSQSAAELPARIPLGGSEYPTNSTQLQLENCDISEISGNLPRFPKLEQVVLIEPTGSSRDFAALQEQLPHVHFIVEKNIFGTLHSSQEEEIDLSALSLTCEEIEDAMAWFPGVERVLVNNQVSDSAALSQFRDKMRSRYKVVWTVSITTVPVRTDAIVFHAAGNHISCADSLSGDLRYCEDMIVVDVGHSRLTDISWVEGMPNLKYLIVTDNRISDISPIAGCKNLIYLELLKNAALADISPVVGCTALQDLNVSNCPRADLTPLAQMTWLNNLVANNCHASQETREYLEEKLPNTHIQCGSGFHNGGGWRELQNYYDMRDIMGMPRNSW